MSHDVTVADPVSPSGSRAHSPPPADVSAIMTAVDAIGRAGERASASRAPVIWLEVEDFLRHFDHMPRPNGMERVSLEIFSEVERQHGMSGRVGFCRLNLVTQEFERVEFPTILEKYLHPPGADAPWHALALLGKRRARALQVGRSLRRLPRYLVRSILPGLGDWLARRFRRKRPADFLRSGDVVVCLGAGWINRRYSRSIAAAKRDHGVRFAVLIHDVIPALFPDWAPFVRRRFPRWLNQILPTADVVLTVSSYSRGDIIKFAARNDIPLARVEVLPLGTGFETRRPRADAEPSRMAQQLPPRFILFVSSIEPRKNHRLLVEAWQRLIARHGGAAVPDLVFVGRPGYLIVDFLEFRSELMASGCVGGKVHILPDLTDAELVEAYRRCLFTVYPSLYEGWGLPVAESLSHGKFCVASGRTSLPEVGGNFIDYFDPDDIEDVVAKIARPLLDPAYLAGREARLKTEYRPASWADCAQALIDALDRANESPATVPAISRDGHIRE